MSIETHQSPIYLDYQSTTPVDSRVAEAMTPFLELNYGNAHSQQHLLGRQAEEAVDRSRIEVANLIGAEPREICFTSGATESNNLAIKGAARFKRSLGYDHLVTISTEHKCVLESVAALESEGFTATILPVKNDGLIDLDVLRAAISERTALVSVMAVNNEIGVVQPLARIGALCRETNTLFHTDAAQGVGKMPLDVNGMNIDLMSISAHKIYGPKGVGALYVRRRPRVRLEPLFSGGGQERGLRSGTLPVQLCVGLGQACRLAEEELSREFERMIGLSRHFCDLLRGAGLPVRINGSAEKRWPGNLNLLFPGLDANALMKNAGNICVSSGSACSSTLLEPSYVLRALGLSIEDANASLRVSFGRMTTDSDIVSAAQRLVFAVQKCKRK